MEGSGRIKVNACWREGSASPGSASGGLADHAHSALDDFEGKLGLLLYDFILLSNGAFTKSGAVQFGGRIHASASDQTG